MVKLTPEEDAVLSARAEEVGVTVARLMVETTLAGDQVESGRAYAALRLLDLEDQIRRIGTNVNQQTRHLHQVRGDLAEDLVLAHADALRAVTRACLSVDATARWVMGKTPAVDPGVVDVEDLAVNGRWSDLDDESGAGSTEGR